jgi:uncharacterized short protein YbdD (DUF466 family)
MKNMEHIKNLLQKLSKDIELLENENSSQIDVDVCLNSIRILYDEVRTIGNKTLKTSTHIEKVSESQIENKHSVTVEEVEEIEEIDFSDEQTETESDKINNDSKELTEDIEKTVNEEESVKNQESEAIKSQTTTKTTNAQVDLFANITSGQNGSTEKQVTLGEHLGANKKSLNETFAGNQQDFSSRINKKPVTDIKAAIGIGDRFLFIKELFGGDNEKFNQTIEVLNGLTDYNQALEHIKTNFSWNTEDSTTKQFLNIISRKYQ